jgi:integrase
MKLTTGLLSMTVKYAYQRGKSIYFQRAIPDDLQARYGSKRVKIRLDAEDMFTAAKHIEALNKSVEAEWALMRGNDTAPPKTLRARAEDLLSAHGIEPGVRIQDPFALGLFYEHLDQKRERFARGDEVVFREASPGEYLAPHEVVAAQMAAGTLKAGLSDALELYLKLHKKQGDEGFAVFTRRAYGRLTAILGEMPLDDLKRADGHKVVAALQRDGLASGTIRRLLNTYVAVVNLYFKEKDIARPNPFASLPIPNEGKDAVKRKPFNDGELEQLTTLCRSKDDPVRWIVAVLADTGARLAEIVGLSLDDIKLDDLVPHIVIQPHPWRSLKSIESARQVPLVGLALWAATRIAESARKGQHMAFPKYTSEASCNADSASATIAKWMRAQGISHTAHELRHTLADRLRDVQCPEDIRLAIGGWATAGVGNQYGTGYGLKVKAEWLERIALP